tara:strand:- start:342 stop:449 length:108 start_codon:yes stop_codon:yes gene_type:complete
MRKNNISNKAVMASTKPGHMAVGIVFLLRLERLKT